MTAAMQAQAYNLERRVRIGWIADPSEYVGGAELTEQTFAAEKPDNVEIVRAIPGRPLPMMVDAWVIHNCVQWGAEIVPFIQNKPVVKYVHDVWPHGDPRLRNWLLTNAYLVFTSPLHLASFDFTIQNRRSDPTMVPPAMDVQRFADAKTLRAAEGTPRVNGALYLAHFLKGADGAVQWAQTKGLTLHLYGIGSHDATKLFGDGVVGHGELSHDDVPSTMAAYTHFVHMPDKPEPFGRTVVEAMAAGCKVHVNDMVGASWWIQNQRQMLEPGMASKVFWRGVEALASGNL